MIYDVVTRWDSAYKMLARAFFLRKAIDTFISEDNELQDFQLSKIEWDQAAIITTILLPFKIISQSLQTTKRPGIDSVYWNYETLFNKIDAIKETFTQPTYRNKSWIQEIHIGVDQLSAKLQKYYTDTDMPFVFPDSCILEPMGKLILFKQPRFGGESEGQYVEKYRGECRQRYVQDYEPLELNTVNLRKRSHEESEDNDDDDDDALQYRSFLHLQVRGSTVENEFDHYLLTPPPDKKVKTLDYWRDHSCDFPHLNLMARDTFAVPATGAGVERVFSKSGQVATWSRARLHAKTIAETMLYKELLVRLGHPLNEAEEQRKAERRKDKKKKALGQHVSQSKNQAIDSDSDDEENEQQVMIDWALEWWRKPGAPIVT